MATKSQHIKTARMSCRKYKTIKDCASALLLQTAYIDENGRKVGFSYEQILRHVKRLHPVIGYQGPHAGSPSKMTIKGLREVGYIMQQDDLKIRLPVRPRRKRGKKRT